MSRPATAKANAAWGCPIPDWVKALAEESDCSSLRKVAAKLRVSPASVSLAINRQRDNFDFIKPKVEQFLMITMVACPVMGVMSRQECLQEQARDFSAANPLQVRLYGACRNGCKYFRGKKEKKHGNQP